MTKLPDAEHPRDPSSELLLLDAIANGDVQAMARLIRIHSELVYSVAHRVLLDPAAAEDVMQEVFLQVWRKPALLTPDGASLRTFLALTARDLAVDLLHKRHPTLPIDELLLTSNKDLLQSTDSTLILESVRSALEDLPPEQSRALDLALFSGCSPVQIAAMTATPLSTIKTRVKEALNAIGRALGR